ncbi:MAG: DMT family transporter [Alphaproteobacteria bacterium]|nr:DMT family transporter [Alphaproteobacteria bacterium]
MALAAAALMGLAIPLARFAYEGGSNSLTVATIRAWVWVVGLGAYVLWCRVPIGLTARERWHTVGLGGLLAIVFYGIIGAVEFISVALTNLLFYTFPSIIALELALVGRGRVGAVRLGTIIAAFAGLLLMLQVSLAEIDGRGVALALAAAVAVATNAVWLNEALPGRDPVVLMLHMGSVAAVLLLVLLVGVGRPVLPVTPLGWVGTLGVAFCQSVGMLLYYLAIPRVGPLRVGMALNVQPVISILAAYAWFGETLTPVQFLGGILVLGSVWVMQWYDLTRDRRRL